MVVCYTRHAVVARAEIGRPRARSWEGVREVRREVGLDLRLLCRMTSHLQDTERATLSP